MRTLKQPRRPLPFALGRFLTLMTGQDAISRRFQARIWWGVLALPAAILILHMLPMVFGYTSILQVIFGDLS